MNENPYRPSSIEESPASVQFPPESGKCPVCHAAVSQPQLYWRSFVKCYACSTELTLGILDDKKIGCGCQCAMLVVVAIVGIAAYSAYHADYFSMIYWLLMIVPVAGIYGAITRWNYGLPYPRSLLQGGRIIFPQSDDAKAWQDSGVHSESN